MEVEEHCLPIEGLALDSDRLQASSLFLPNFGNSTIGLSSSALERRMISHAQCACVLGVLLLVLVVELARESRMIIHVTV